MSELHGPPCPGFEEHHQWHSPLPVTSDYNEIGRTGRPEPGYVLNEFGPRLLFCLACGVVLHRLPDHERSTL